MSDSTSSNRATLQNMFAAIAGGDPTAIGEAMQGVFDPAVVIHESEGLPYGGDYHGLAGLFEVSAKVGEKLVAEAPKSLHLVVDGDFAVSMTQIPWRDGRQPEMLVSEWYRFENGKVVEIWPFYWNTTAFHGTAVAG
jgi:hypothetical protein